ncbi:hypothetical protein KJ068_22990 [bacterium]|nr:hypothetical protein [bacterium]
MKRLVKLIILVASAGIFAWILLRRLESSTASQGVAEKNQQENASISHAGYFGFSGNLYAMIGLPAAAQKLAPAIPASLLNAMHEPGIHQVDLATPDGQRFLFISLLPFKTKREASLRGYHMGRWPDESEKGTSLPEGFIEVTPENQTMPLSKSFRLRDFLPHDQAEVWPKFIVLRMSLLDKLELLAQELDQRKLPSRLHIMSGFRTPQYNSREVGRGRAGNSRHIYGDGADVFVDHDRNNLMDDLNGDGETTLDDAHFLLALADNIEKYYPELAGGLSAYPATAAHGPFLHIDVRGVRVRW